MKRRQMLAAPGAGRAAFGPLRRRWHLVAVAFIVVVVGSLWQYAGPSAASRQMYVARQALRIAVLPAGAPTTYDDYLATQQEAAIARALAQGSALANPALDAPILARAPLYLPHSYSVTSASPALTATAIGQALSATNSGSEIALAARWSSAAVAQALIKAAGDVIIHADSALLLSGVSLPATSLTNATVSFSLVGAASQPTPDATSDANAWQVAISRIALGVLAGLLLVYVVEWFGAPSASPSRAEEATRVDEAQMRSVERS